MTMDDDNRGRRRMNDHHTGPRHSQVECVNGIGCSEVRVPSSCQVESC
jgi:hypothetical protein